LCFRQLSGRGAQQPESLVVHGFDQLLPGREVPVEGRIPDPGGLGDVVE
jgi:hypothetical protein